MRTVTPHRPRAAARGAIAALGALAALSLAGGCVFMPELEDLQAAQETQALPLAPDPDAPRLPVLETRHHVLESPDQEVIGDVQVIFARYENTFTAIARVYNVGYEHMRRANPGVDQWLPGEGTPVYLPTQWVLPDAPREGIVINVPAMRLMYFSKEKGVDGAVVQRVTSHPVGIGRQDWATPFGVAKVTAKARDPVWYPPASVRAEHAAMGDPLPAVVPPGPDNPLGRHVLQLSMPGYLIHGTNKPAGVGMRVSHGCIRMYPEDIEALFDRVQRGTPVHLVNQPVLAGWRDGVLYLEVHPPLEEDERDLAADAAAVIDKALERAGRPNVALDDAAIAKVLEEKRGIPFPISVPGASPERYLAAARIVENTVPVAPAEQTADAT
ncbi:MAG TPA: L,D-transpeptidase family protein [Gammaproteobacteria bacterium]